MKSNKGFSLIELMIVVAIIGIIGAIAFPSYDKYMMKARRGDDGLAVLQQVVDREERYYLQNNQYTSDMPGDLNMSTTSPDGHYTLAVTVPVGGQSFSATATPVATGPQAKDVDCTSLTITSTGQKSATAGTGGDASKCW